MSRALRLFSLAGSLLLIGLTTQSAAWQAEKASDHTGANGGGWVDPQGDDFRSPAATPQRWRIKKELDVGHLLTLMTVAAGFVLWVWTTIKTRKDKANEDARGGALRLLLYLLRERGGIIDLQELRERYNDPNLKRMRLAYSHKDYLFTDNTKFEAAIYRLDYESKIEFVSPQQIRFRVHTPYQPYQGDRLPSSAEKTYVLEILLKELSTGLENKSPIYDLEAFVQAALRLSGQETYEVLQAALHEPDPEIQKLAAILIGRYSPGSSATSVQS
jgi:hypothetical protein